MKVYTIKKGTKVILSNNDGLDFHETTAKKTTSWCDYIDDYVYDHNQYLFNPDYIPCAHPRMIKMFENGCYSMFPLDEKLTKSEYKFVFVNYNDLEVLC